VAAITGTFLGLIIGGVLAPVDWRLVFLVSVPFGLFGTVWAYLKLVDLSERRPPTPLPADTVSSEDFRRATERVLLQQAATGEGVLLGRGAVIVLRNDPRALRVRLDGPAERRARMALRFDPNLDRERAKSALRQFDNTHEACAQQFYGVSIRDPALYHLMLDSTAIELDACVDIIARAAGSVPTAMAQESMNGPQQ
jgi:cytidylate kinase